MDGGWFAGNTSFNVCINVYIGLLSFLYPVILRNGQISTFVTSCILGLTVHNGAWKFQIRVLWYGISQGLLPPFLYKHDPSPHRSTKTRWNPTPFFPHKTHERVGHLAGISSPQYLGRFADSLGGITFTFRETAASIVRIGGSGYS
jgi:hypothetical protein